ncbi:GILT-like protein 1 [Penaeus indicus]|uniref:GILT-like protein 1 n=1 Tax=Penaeus indicus TaxID=29960 RepID=UPI00300D1E7C
MKIFRAKNESLVEQNLDCCIIGIPSQILVKPYVDFNKTQHYEYKENHTSARLPLLLGCRAKEQGTVADRVKVSVYFESLCSDSMRFFKNQLYPVWKDLQDIIDLEFIPFGKARAIPTETGDYEFECQHGPDECFGNRVMSCAQNSLPIGTQVEFFQCMMTKRYPAFFGKQCSEKVGIAWTPLQECVESVKSAAMLYQNGVRTASLKPQVYFIPTITINGRYDSRRLRISLMALRSQICASYDGPPHQNCL